MTAVGLITLRASQRRQEGKHRRENRKSLQSATANSLLVQENQTLLIHGEKRDIVRFRFVLRAPDIFISVHCLSTKGNSKARLL